MFPSAEEGMATTGIRPYPWRVKDRLVAQVRRTIAYNRQPRKLAVLPVVFAVTGLGAYGFWTGSYRFLGLTIGLAVVGTFIDVTWWVITRLRGSSAPF